MDILNPNPAAGFPQALWLTYWAIMDYPDLNRDEILALVVPEAMRAHTPGDGAHVKRALAGLVEFRLVERSGEGLHSCAKVDSPHAFLRLLRNRLVRPPDELGDGFEGAPDVRAGLIWLLRQSPTEPLDYSVNVAPVMPTKLFTNGAHWNTFRSWCEALGFGRPALTSMVTGSGQKVTGAKVVPDPTVAVIDAIRYPFGEPLAKGAQIPIGSLLEFLRNELPVLPGHPSATYPGLGDDSDGGVRALGLALASAEERHLLTMTYQSDPSGVMALPDAQEHGKPRYVSAVTITKDTR
ncbi:hypothetical protein M6D93_15200 [Jatrophihabitans telluris]|uniref:Uncharacterized protein n=1 Tax=Jatrophihabitans telluris TaxID=2038343 RepID=A0ABY4QWU5_9ACTN|nr:hypothetical protein [Jatrophihabitans telluris]UQX87637.1 hypothetical protein M6D93_15200 [Jatrophihabitans telluris]